MKIQITSLNYYLYLAILGILLALFWCLKTKTQDAEKSWLNVKKINYHGWKDSYKLSNGIVEMIIVPSIGRVMSFSFPKKENIFWENPAMSGRLFPVSLRKWINYGGYKLWLVPLLGWPPDPYIDRGRYIFTVQPEGRAVMSGAIHPKHGIRLKFEFQFRKNSSTVILKHCIENCSDKTIKASLWGVSQVRPQGTVSVLSQFQSPPRWDFTLSRIKRIPYQCINESLKHYSIRHGMPDKKKIFFMLKQGWLSYEHSGIMFKKTFKVPARLCLPEKHSNAEVYFSPQYIELETLSPYFSIPPKASQSFTVSWSLTPVKI